MWTLINIITYSMFFMSFLFLLQGKGTNKILSTYLSGIFEGPKSHAKSWTRLVWSTPTQIITSFSTSMYIVRRTQWKLMGHKFTQDSIWFCRIFNQKIFFSLVNSLLWFLANKKNSKGWDGPKNNKCFARG